MEKELSAEISMEGWCACESEPSEPFYHEDFQLVFENCVEKHHWHCGWCLGLVQIG